jgi:hypothetical protein
MTESDGGSLEDTFERTTGVGSCRNSNSELGGRAQRGLGRSVDHAMQSIDER